MEVDTVVYWLRSWSRDGNDLVKCYYKGTWKYNGPDGLTGDVKLRPYVLGKGPFTFTVDPGSIVDKNGNGVL